MDACERLVHLGASLDRTRSEAAVLNRNSRHRDLETARPHQISEAEAMTMPEAEAAPTAEQRSEPPETDTALSAQGVATPGLRAEQKPPRSTLVPSVIVGLVVAAVAGLSIWYLVRPQPLLVQGEVDATRFDLAARVDGRVAEIPVERGQNIDAGAVLVKIDNPGVFAETSGHFLGPDA